MNYDKDEFTLVQRDLISKKTVSEEGIRHALFLADVREVTARCEARERQEREQATS